MPNHTKANIRVTANQQQGGRKYMEDITHIHFEESGDGKILWSFFAIFDGHGGSHAAQFARKHLMKLIVAKADFWTNDDNLILEAIREGFLECHKLMWDEHKNWPVTSSGFTSTAGTTASILFIKNDKAYIGHVGDSAIILGKKIFPDCPVQPVKLTTDHKPDNPDELRRICSVGGDVKTKNGVDRVVWLRQKRDFRGVLMKRSFGVDRIPFLAIARSLGDLWSYIEETREYAVSPQPDVSVIRLDWIKHKCFILGSDGLTNMVRAENAVQIVMNVEQHCYNKVVKDNNVSENYWVNPSQTLVNTAIARWQNRGLRADNTSAIVILIDPPHKPRKDYLLEQREKYMKQSQKEIDIDSSIDETINKVVHGYIKKITPSKYRSTATENMHIDNGHIKTLQESKPKLPAPKQTIFNHTRLLTPTKYRKVSKSADAKKDVVKDENKERRASTGSVRNLTLEFSGYPNKRGLRERNVSTNIKQPVNGLVKPIIHKPNGIINAIANRLVDGLDGSGADKRKSCPGRIEGTKRKRRCSGGYVQVSNDIVLDDSDVQNQSFMLDEARKIVQERNKEKREEAKQLAVSTPRVIVTRKRAHSARLEINPVKRLRSGREVLLTPINVEKNKTISLAKTVKNRLNKNIIRVLRRNRLVKAVA